MYLKNSVLAQLILVFRTATASPLFSFLNEHSTKTQPKTMTTKQLHYLLIIICALSSSVATCGAAPTPYFEDFESYAVGDTPVANFTEVDSTAWTIAAPSFSGQAYENEISVFSPGPGFAAGENSSAVVDFPSLAASGFSISTSFVIDELTLDGSDPNNTAKIGLVARAADSMPASSGGDRYEVSYFLDDDGLGHPTGRLYLTEHNLFFGDSLNKLSTASLPVALGDVYTFSFEGRVVGGSLKLRARLTNTTTLSGIKVLGTDSSNVLGGSFFGYFNNVRVEDGGTVTLNADFDDFFARRRPATAELEWTD